MKKIDLKTEQVSIDELLEFAAAESVLIRNKNGEEFVLEAAETFDREIAELSRSEKFQSFLAGRSRQAGRTTLEEVEHRVSLAEQALDQKP
jgi:hypothetical protein